MEANKDVVMVKMASVYTTISLHENPRGKGIMGSLYCVNGNYW